MTLHMIGADNRYAPFFAQIFGEIYTRPKRRLKSGADGYGNEVYLIHSQRSFFKSTLKYQWQVFQMFALGESGKNAAVLFMNIYLTMDGTAMQFELKVIQITLCFHYTNGCFV